MDWGGNQRERNPCRYGETKLFSETTKPISKTLLGERAGLTVTSLWCKLSSFITHQGHCFCWLNRLLILLIVLQYQCGFVGGEAKSSFNCITVSSFPHPDPTSYLLDYSSWTISFNSECAISDHIIEDRQQNAVYHAVQSDQHYSKGRIGNIWKLKLS